MLSRYEILELARKGVFGTSENPNRSSLGKAHFWNAYFGIDAFHTPQEGGVNYEYVEAGRLFRGESVMSDYIWVLLENDYPISVSVDVDALMAVADDLDEHTWMQDPLSKTYYGKDEDHELIYTIVELPLIPHSKEKFGEGE